MCSSLNIQAGRLTLVFGAVWVGQRQELQHTPTELCDRNPYTNCLSEGVVNNSGALQLSATSFYWTLGGC